MKIVYIVRGMVAWLLLWPLDLVDYLIKDFWWIRFGPQYSCEYCNGCIHVCILLYGCVLRL